jgi:serine/threonine protein phosphatase PrpC
MKRSIAFLLPVFSLAMVAQAKIEWGLSSRQGKRNSMEEGHLHEMMSPSSGLFAVFDGHAGSEAATIAEHEFAAIFQKNLNGKKIEKSFEKTFTDLDAVIQQKTEAGTTAMVAYVNNNKITFAWAGDTRALLFVPGEGEFAGEGLIRLFESEDHKPIPGSDEYERLQKVFGSKIKDWVKEKGVWRLGGLAVSRSLGDKPYKEKLKAPEALIAMPEVGAEYPFKSGSVAIIACDGLWDVLSNNEIEELLRKALNATQGQTNRETIIKILKEQKFDISNPSADKEILVELPEKGSNERLKLIARALRNAAYKKGSKDNLSVLIVEHMP